MNLCSAGCFTVSWVVWNSLPFVNGASSHCCSDGVWTCLLGHSTKPCPLHVYLIHLKVWFLLPMKGLLLLVQKGKGWSSSVTFVYLIRGIYGKNGERKMNGNSRLHFFSLSILCFVTYLDRHILIILKTLKLLWLIFLNLHLCYL